MSISWVFLTGSHNLTKTLYFKSSPTLLWQNVYRSRLASPVEACWVGGLGGIKMCLNNMCSSATGLWTRLPLLFANFEQWPDGLQARCGVSSSQWLPLGREPRNYWVIAVIRSPASRVESECTAAGCGEAACGPEGIMIRLVYYALHVGKRWGLLDRAGDQLVQ